MSNPTYWLDLFTVKTWNEFVEAGASISGFRESRWNIVQKMKPGDHLICYLTGLSRLVGILEVDGEPFLGTERIWADDLFPSRVAVRPIVVLTPETAVPITSLRDQLTIFHGLDNPNAWSGHVRGSPTRWKAEDGRAILAALKDAVQNPVARPVPKGSTQPVEVVESPSGPVTIPEPVASSDEMDIPTPARELREHEKIQWLLVKTGSATGHGVWIAKNDRSLEVDGHRASELRGMRTSLAVQFPPAAQKTIELIDVLWLQGDTIVAAFEIEKSTSIYSGLLRMSDLIASVPNLKLPLYIVAPDERRDSVKREINRPTFAHLSPPLVEVCRYISFSSLEEWYVTAQRHLAYIRASFLDELAESCEIEDI